jgi:hypothetical protein
VISALIGFAVTFLSQGILSLFHTSIGSVGDFIGLYLLPGQEILKHFIWTATAIDFEGGIRESLFVVVLPRPHQAQNRCVFVYRCWLTPSLVCEGCYSRLFVMGKDIWLVVVGYGTGYVKFLQYSTPIDLMLLKRLLASVWFEKAKGKLFKLAQF